LSEMAKKEDLMATTSGDAGKLYITVDLTKFMVEHTAQLDATIEAFITKRIAKALALANPPSSPPPNKCWGHSY
jgi:hypothetical protein